MKKSPLASILSIVFIDLIGFGMIIPILPLYAQRFQATEWQIGILLASYSFMQDPDLPFGCLKALRVQRQDRYDHAKSDQVNENNRKNACER